MTTTEWEAGAPIFSRSRNHWRVWDEGHWQSARLTVYCTTRPLWPQRERPATDCIARLGGWTDWAEAWQGGRRGQISRWWFTNGEGGEAEEAGGWHEEWAVKPCGLHGGICLGLSGGGQPSYGPQE